MVICVYLSITLCMLCVLCVCAQYFEIIKSPFRVQFTNRENIAEPNSTMHYVSNNESDRFCIHKRLKNFHWTFVLFIWFYIFAFLVLFRFYAMLFRLQFRNDRNVNAWIQQGKNWCVRVLYLLEETILTVSRLVQSKKCVQSIIISSLIE